MREKLLITPKTKKALEILAAANGLTAANFARLMWTDSPAWKRSHNTGNGATKGKGMWLAAGSYLAKLKIRKMAATDGNGIWSITGEGRKILEDSANS